MSPTKFSYLWTCSITGSSVILAVVVHATRNHLSLEPLNTNLTPVDLLICHCFVYDMNLHISGSGVAFRLLLLLLALLYRFHLRMESIQEDYGDDFMEQASKGSPGSPDISDIIGVPWSNPRVGEEYQVEIPSMMKKSERLQLLMNPADLEVKGDNSLSFAIGLPNTVTWIHNDVGKGNNNSAQLGKSENHVSAPGTLSNSWTETDAKSFILGLFIFGKSFIKIKEFLENKGMGEILSFYYGKFYKSDEYRRWSDCRKIKGRKCIIGQKLFTGQRQHELLSRLIPCVSEESQDTLLQVSKSYVEGKASVEEYISSLKSTVGLGALVEAVGIGKEKEDLTSFAVELGKNDRVFSKPTCKAWSSLGPGEIVKFLTGGFRLSKAKSSDLFWEAVWPRLLARGWHSEQPKNQGYVISKDYLVFLIPGIKKFSRKLVKGDHYFDSVSDVLSKVVAEPNLLELEGEAKVGSCSDKEQEKGSDKDHQCYLKPRASTAVHIKLMIVDTSSVHRGKASNLMEFKSLPVNSVRKVEVNAFGKAYKKAKNTKKANHSKDMSKNIDRKLTKFTVVDTSMLYKGKLLKVRKLRYLPVKFECASKMTGLSRESKDGSSGKDSPSVMGANIPTCDTKNISNMDRQKGISDSDATNQKEANGKPENDANKKVESQKNPRTSVSDDKQVKRTIKHQFSRRARLGSSNQAVLPTKRRRLTACAKAETSRLIENSLKDLVSEKLAFSQSSSFPNANQNVDDPVNHKQNGSGIDNKESTPNEACQHASFSCVKVEKCESQPSVTCIIPRVPLTSEYGKMMAKVEEGRQCLKENEKPLRASCVVGSKEKQPSTSPRRQSKRNRPLTVRAMESLANEFLHVQRKQKRKDMLPHKDAFNPCRRARTRGRTMLHRHSSDHATAVVVEEKHLNGDCKVCEIFPSQ
ncbi:hypothetical protein RJT34_16043 [Clitoria ternatea]|uniref:SANT domain-containing protein n=1 Tax=Clitoria ternatea TaxID=43366 RepID=A0AAN9PCJ4_CLITE